MSLMIKEFRDIVSSTQPSLATLFGLWSLNPGYLENAGQDPVT